MPIRVRGLKHIEFSPILQVMLSMKSILELMMLSLFKMRLLISFLIMLRFLIRPQLLGVEMLIQLNELLLNFANFTAEFRGTIVLLVMLNVLYFVIATIYLIVASKCDIVRLGVVNLVSWPYPSQSPTNSRPHAFSNPP